MSLVLEMIHLISRCDNPLLTCLILTLRLMGLRISQSLKPPLILEILKVLVLRLLSILKCHLSKLPLTLDPLFFPCWTRTKTRMGNIFGSNLLCPRATPFLMSIIHTLLSTPLLSPSGATVKLWKINFTLTLVFPY